MNSQIQNDNTHRNKTIAKNCFTAMWIDKDKDAIKNFMTSDVIGHFENEETHGSDELRRRYENMLLSFPDISIEDFCIISEGSSVIIRYHACGTFKKEYHGMHPTGNVMVIWGMYWLQICDGAIVEIWENQNMSYLFRKHLEKAQAKIKTLQGIIPICSYCKKIRNDKGYWDKLEKYLSDHSNAELSHGLCPDCLAKEYPEIYEKMKQNEEIE